MSFIVKQRLECFRLALTMAIWIGMASIAFADSVRVTVDRALIWNRPSGVSVVLSQAKRGDRLEVVRRVDEWYEVVVPGSARAGQPSGFVRVSQAEIADVGPPSAAAQAILEGRPGTTSDASRSQPANQTRSAQPPGAKPKNSFLHLDAGFRFGGDDFVRTATAFTTDYAEDGSIVSNYGKGQGFQFDVMAGGKLSKQFGIGVDVSAYPRTGDVTIEASVPHPFYFGQLRDASFVDSSLKGTELGIHVPLIWMPAMSGPLSVMIFGGPSYFHVTQDVVTDLNLSEQYPYDTVTITGTVVEKLKGNTFGFHVGGDVSYFFSPSTGIGASVRYSRATMKFSDDSDDVTTEGHAGSASISGGIRFRF